MRQVQFEVADVTKREFPNESFDVIFSRDTLLHIKDKHALISSFYVSAVNYSDCYFTSTITTLGIGVCVLTRNRDY